MRRYFSFFFYGSSITAGFSTLEIAATPGMATFAILHNEGVVKSASMHWIPEERKKTPKLIAHILFNFYPYEKYESESSSTSLVTHQNHNFLRDTTYVEDHVDISDQLKWKRVGNQLPRQYIATVRLGEKQLKIQGE